MPPTTAQLTTAAMAIAEGQSEVAAARAANLPRSTMQYHLQRDEIQALIKECQLRLVTAGLAKAVENQVSKIDASAEIALKIRQGKDLTDGSVKLLELGHDAEKQVLQSVGIHNAHTQSITLNQIMIDARQELSPAVEAMLVRHLGCGMAGGEVVDADQD